MKNKLLILLMLAPPLSIVACAAPEPGTRIWDIVASTQLNALTIDSKADLISADFMGIYTLLDTAQKKSNTISSKLDTIESLSDNLALDYSGIFTAIEALEQKLCTVESKAEELDNSTFAIVGYFGLAIRNEDLSTTGTTLNEPGAYFLAEHINYAPSGTGTAAITINNDNITLNLNNRTLNQTNAMGTTVGVRVTSGNTNIQIVNGTIENTTAQAILVNSNNSCVAVKNINTKLNSNESGITFESGCSGLTLDFVTTISSDNNGIDFDSCSDIQVSNAFSAGNGVPAEGAGIQFSECTRIKLTNSIFNDNTHFGVEYASSTTAGQAEFQGLTILDNGNVGISLENIRDVLISNCYVVGHNVAGARLTGCERIKLIENMFDNNDDYNIWLRSGTTNCYLFANCLMLAGTSNLQEDATSGPNSILGNYALATTFTGNYDILGTTTVNLDTFDQAGAFPSPAPVSWKNMSVQT